MYSSHSLQKLISIFSPETAQWVIPALREDSLVFQQLEDLQFLAKAERCLGGDPKQWTPGNLALLAIDGANNTEWINRDARSFLEDDKRQKARSILDQIIQNGGVPQNLIEAGWAALAYCDRIGNFNGRDRVFPEVQFINNRKKIGGWQTILSCAYSYHDQPDLFLKGLLNKRNYHLSIQWLDHIVFTQPLTFDDQLNLLYPLVNEFSAMGQVEWIRMIFVSGRKLLARLLARKLLENSGGYWNRLRQRMNPEAADWAELSGRTLAYQQLAALCELADYPTQAQSLLNTAKEFLNYWLAGLQIQSSVIVRNVPEQRSAEGNTDGNHIYSGESKGLLSEYSMVDSTGDNHLINSREDYHRLYPNAKIHHALRIWNSGEQKFGVEIAREAVGEWIEQVEKNGLVPSLPKFITGWSPSMMVSSLMTMGMISESLQCSNHLIDQFPNDLELMNQLCILYKNLGKLDLSLNYARLIQLEEPDNLEWQRRIAELLEGVDNWHEALSVRQSMLDAIETPSIEDWLLLANAAYHAGNDDLAIQTCQMVLQKSPDNGGAHIILGKISYQQGKPEEAKAYLVEATHLAPDQAEGWISLAEIQQFEGDTEKALETLQKGVAAAPANAHLHYALGRIHLDNGMVAEALPLLEKAVRLSPDSLPVVVSLVETLYTLGHQKDAELVLSNASQRWSAEPQLAYLQSQLDIDRGDIAAAMQSLEFAVRYEDAKPEWFVSYVDLIVQVEEQSGNKNVSTLANAQQMLQKALVTIPNDFRARHLLGKVLYLKGEVAVAYALFSQLLEQNEAFEKDNQWKLKADLSKAALSLGMTDTALAVLQEISTQNPRVHEIHQLLAEAYIAAKLNQEAQAEADAALQLAPTNIGILTWYARLMEKIGQADRALDALRCATQIEDKNAELFIRLASLYARAGDQQAVLDTLASIHQIDTLSLNDRWQAAILYEGMREFRKALDILMGQLVEEEKGNPRLYLEIARLNEKLGALDSAAEQVAKASELRPNLVVLYAYQAFLYSRLGRVDAAIACFKLAINLSASDSSASAYNDYLDDPNLIGGLADMEWRRNFSRPEMLHYQYAILLHTCERYQEALEQAEDAYDLNPYDWDVCLLAAELARSLLYIGRAKRLLGIDRAFSGDLGDACPSAECFALAVEIALDEGNLEESERYLAAGFEKTEQHPRLQVAGARIHMRKGEFAEAQKLMESAIENLQVPCSDDGHSNQNSTWFGVAEIEMGDWSSGLECLKKNVVEYDCMPLAHLEYLRALVLAAENHQDYELVGCVHHAPPPNASDSGSYEEFQTCLAALDKYSRTDEINRWRIRGLAAYRPTPINLRALTTLPMVMDDPVAYARGLRQAGTPAEAIQLMDKYPESPDFLFQMLLSSIDINLETGLEISKRMNDTSILSPIHHAGIAKIAESTGLLEDAREAITRALNVWNDEPRWHALAAKLNEKLNDIQKARSHWQAAVDLEPNNSDYLLMLATSHMNVGDLDKAVSVLEDASQLNRNQVEIWMMLATIHMNLGKYEEALEYAEFAGTADSNSSRSLELAGQISLKMGRLDLAIQYAQRAWDRSPLDPGAILLLSQVFEAAGRTQDALKVIEKIDDIVAISPELGIQQAKLIRKVRGSKGALPIMQELAQKYPDHAEVLNTMAEIQAECGTLLDAVRSATASLRLKPEQPALHLLLGRIHRGTGQLDQAVHHFGEAIRQSPANIDAYIELGKTYQDQRQHLQAVRVYEEAINIAPNDHRPYYHAAITLREAKDYRGAESLLRRAVQLSPDDLSIRRQLAAIVALNMVYNSQEMH